MWRHVVDGGYLPFFLACAKITSSLTFKFGKDRILVNTLDYSRVWLVRFTIPSKGRGSRKFFTTEDRYFDLDRDFIEISRVNPQTLEFIVNDSSLTIVGKGDYIIRKSIDVGEVHPISEPDVKLSNRIIIGGDDLRWFKNLLKNLKSAEKIVLIKEPRKLVRIAGVDRYRGETFIEAELPIHVVKSISFGKSAYDGRLIKHLNTILKEIKPEKLILSWGVEKPMLVQAYNEKGEFRYWIAPRVYE